ncbi:hypothetical protein [Planctomicrobium piriforme]|uniref:Uncharacterized protein n=1 Tax=Planctomicrobium piriforme TaxID=1576369 RepID=A0A1I3AZX2_9PLAN|nr:hypothetical protein [Planctomicrobium piriforme]SFH55583.1 hypothetical protein SAMN05421753_101146 [Planctomicrobium piriforme]
MASKTDRRCLSCEGEMRSIVVMDKTEDSAGTPLQYRSPEDKLGFWTCRYASAGDLSAMMCVDCGLVQLYGKVGDKAG